MPRTFLVIDDHPLVQEAVASALQSLGSDVRVVAARTAEEALTEMGRQSGLGLVLLDLALPDMSGLELIRRLHAQQPALPILVLSALEAPEHVRHAIAAGAMGFVPKSAPTRVLLDAVNRVLSGDMTLPHKLQPAATVTAAENGIAENAAAQTSQQPAGMAQDGLTPGVADQAVAVLTARQVQVLSRLCEGKTNKQIATELDLSEKTVKAHVTAIFKVLGVVNRTQAVLAARRLATIMA